MIERGKRLPEKLTNLRGEQEGVAREKCLAMLSSTFSKASWANSPKNL
jgi:hypothetical protein